MKRGVLEETVERVLVGFEVDDVCSELIEDAKVVLVSVWVFCV